MTISVTPIPKLTEFATPDLTLTTANSAGSAGVKTTIRSDASILTYDATVSTTIASGASAATGSASTAARRDHTHGAFTVTAAATQAEEEAATSTTVYTTPGRQKYHPGTAKGWVFCDDSSTFPTDAASYNVDGLIDGGTGRLNITWDVDFSSSNYASIAMAGVTLFAFDRDNYAAGTSYIGTANSSGAYTDPARISCVALGDQ